MKDDALGLMVILLLTINPIIGLYNVLMVRDLVDYNNRFLPMYEEAWAEYQKRAELNTIEWESTNKTCDYVEEDVGYADKVLLFVAPFNEFSVVMEGILNEMNISYVPICIKDFEKCKERGYFTNNSDTLREKYEIYVAPTLVFDNCTKKRIGTLGIHNRDAEIDELTKLLIDNTKED